MMKILDKLSLNVRLFFYNAVLISFVLIVGVLAQLTIGANNKIIEKLTASQASYWVNQAMLAKSDLQASLWYSFSSYVENTGATEGISDVQDYMKTFAQDMDKYAAESKFTEAEKTQYDKINAEWDKSVIEINKVLDELKQGKATREDLTKSINAVGDKMLNMNDLLSDVLAKMKTSKTAIYLAANAKEKRDFIGLIVILAIAVIIGVFSFLFARKLSGNISTQSRTLFSRANEISTVGSTLKQSSNSLTSSIKEQSHSIHETTAAINEITSMVNRTTENASELSEVAKAASEKAVDGQKTMELLVNAMETIQESNAQLQNISTIIGQIHSKTAVINDIVSKTELLSLNASIESARAGEHGKGFAVVAEEVGNLAKISGKSAQEIQTLITTSQEQVTNILGITKDRVDQAKSVTVDAQKTFSIIAENISTLTAVMTQIIDASKEQEVGVRQISSAMSQIDKSTHTIQTASDITSKNADSLVAQSEKLNSSSKEIEVIVRGSA